MQTFFGSRMVRAEVVYLNPDGTTPTSGSTAA